MANSPDPAVEVEAVLRESLDGALGAASYRKAARIVREGLAERGYEIVHVARVQPEGPEGDVEEIVGYMRDAIQHLEREKVEGSRLSGVAVVSTAWVIARLKRWTTALSHVPADGEQLPVAPATTDDDLPGTAYMRGEQPAGLREALTVAEIDTILGEADWVEVTALNAKLRRMREELRG